MSGSGNDQNDSFWIPENARQSGQPNFISQEVPPVTSSSYFQSNAVPEVASSSGSHGVPSYGPGSGDNFTVLSVGFGNFIKVYHQPNDDINMNNPVPGKYEYELFSNNTSFLRPGPGFGFLFHQQPQQQSIPQPQTSASQPQTMPSEAPSSNTNMLINQLVGNWAPTVSGTYSPFGGGGPSLLTEGLPRSSEIYVQQTQQPQQPSPQHEASPVNQQQQPTIAANNSSPIAVKPQPSAPASSAVPANASLASTTASYNQLNDDNSAKLNQNVNKKQRIVAEVKPMRMSYSDVLSKQVSTSSGSGGGANQPTAVLSAQNSSGKSAATTFATNGTNGKSSNKANTPAGQHGGKNKNGSHPGAQSAGEKKATSSTSGLRKSGGQVGGTAASNGQPQLHGADGVTSTVRHSQQHQSVAPNVAGKGNRKADKSSGNKSGPRGNVSNRTDLSTGSVGGKKTRYRSYGDAYTIQDVQGGNATSGKGSDYGNDDTVEELDEDDDEEDDGDEVDEDYEEYEDDGQQQQHSFMYNVKKNNNPNDTHFEKISGARSVYKKGGSRTSASTRGKAEKSYPSSSTGSKRGQRPRKNQKYEFVQKMLNTWFEYLVFAVLWLWSLVSDVVYLSLRLCWDYLVAGYQYCHSNIMVMRQEFQQNRPGTWFKGLWNSFDSRFAKDSKWAFWRGKRKPASNEEQTTSGKNYYKDGRLPSTADEAMSSLLNCKGKDAYSILGVSPDCSQEQIRKHYKKIAVLVHPDKNKQPGAEEAFKVLQRSFELIGEPENRKAYDQSLAEALHAEKTWSEINDLLAQLHTKISEAANTIRCSSCCLRHPRKPTGRPHYAARECNSCKIRHSAREGDIWAETSFFGLRWKYLAMMEGNVYDITEWANCQKGALSHLQPNSHIVQYRIVLGGNSQQQQQKQQGGGQQPADKDAARSRKDLNASEPNLDDFLNNIYGGQNQQQQQTQGNSRRRHRRN
ncbi:uncharacterized protein LOC129760387 [Uranotaenia lowii]|uniref:uncharacterized protein LOC129760387 n=1 Tax=Uranotaenia lowii TaxID=190385 RepID=UPI00247B02FD|nr:uncharacterized protein LOC129760387 [Uranotaenia lowii]XP_055614011.1 uncharacterized protein LOC129760387 [Uranotaenia lowii]